MARSGIDALTIRFIPDLKFIKLLSDFALSRYCDYALLPLVLRVGCSIILNQNFCGNV
jgi:hypothetical protein